MALIYDEVMATVESDLPFHYTDKDVLLYALSVGMGSDPLDARELPFVYEQGEPLRTVPTLSPEHFAASQFSTVISRPSNGWR